jgi:hypothetical protein
VVQARVGDGHVPPLRLVTQHVPGSGEVVEEELPLPDLLCDRRVVAEMPSRVEG